MSLLPKIARFNTVQVFGPYNENPPKMHLIVVPSSGSVEVYLRNGPNTDDYQIYEVIDASGPSTTLSRHYEASNTEFKVVPIDGASFGWGGSISEAQRIESLQLSLNQPDLIAAVLADPAVLSVAFNIDPNSPQRTFSTEKYHAVVTGSATIADGGSNPNLTTTTIMSYTGDGLPTGRGGTTQKYGADGTTEVAVMDLNNLSSSIGHVGGVTWEQSGEKTITATTYAIHDGQLVYATATHTETIRDTVADMLEENPSLVYVVAPDGVYGDQFPAGVNFSETHSGISQAVRGTGGLVLFKAGSTIDELGYGFRTRMNLVDEVTFATYNPDDLTDRSGRVTLDTSRHTDQEYIGTTVHGGQLSRAGSSAVFHNIDLVGDYNSDGTGDNDNLRSGIIIQGGDYVTIHNCTGDGILSLATCDVDAGQVALSCSSGFNNQNYGLLQGQSKSLVCFGNISNQPDGTRSGALKGSDNVYPWHGCAVRWTPSVPNSVWCIWKNWARSLTGWSTPTMVDGVLQGVTNPAWRILWSHDSDPDITGHDGCFMQNYSEGGYTIATFSQAFDGQQLFAGEVLIGYNHFRGGKFTSSAVTSQYGGTVAVGNFVEMPDIVSVAGDNRFLEAFTFRHPNSIADSQNGQELETCYAFGNTTVLHQDAASYTPEAQHLDFNVVGLATNAYGVMATVDHDNVTICTQDGPANFADFDGAANILGELLEPRLATGEIQMRIDARESLRPATGGLAGRLEPV